MCFEKLNFCDEVFFMKFPLMLSTLKTVLYAYICLSIFTTNKCCVFSSGLEKNHDFFFFEKNLLNQKNRVFFSFIQCE